MACHRWEDAFEPDGDGDFPTEALSPRPTTRQVYVVTIGRPMVTLTRRKGGGQPSLTTSFRDSGWPISCDSARCLTKGQASKNAKEKTVEEHLAATQNLKMKLVRSQNKFTAPDDLAIDADETWVLPTCTCAWATNGNCPQFATPRTQAASVILIVGRNPSFGVNLWIVYHGGTDAVHPACVVPNEIKVCHSKSRWQTDDIMRELTDYVVEQV